MCGVFGQVKLGYKSDFPHKAKRTLEERTLKKGISFQKNFNIWTGMDAYVISSQETDYYQSMQFGLTPHWAHKKMYLFNARSEGKLNTENDTLYKGSMGIHQMPSFKESIRQRRCIIPVDYFIEGTEKEKLNKPFLIHQKNRQSFFIGGIWDEWVDKTDGELIKSFSIITTPAAPLLQRLPHHRSPLILHPKDLDVWLDQKASMVQIDQLLKPFDSSQYQYYPISSKIKSKQNERSLFLTVDNNSTPP